MVLKSGNLIPADNFRKLIMLLLLVAPLGAQESLASYPDRFRGAELESLRTTAECILAAFLDVERSPGIKFHEIDLDMRLGSLVHLGGQQVGEA